MPEVRAAQLKEELAALADMGSEAATCVVAEISPSTLSRIVQATRVDWLPAELNVELVHAGQRVLGDERLRRWGRASARHSTSSSFFGPILQGVIGAFGLSPAAVFRAVPAAFRAAYRGCGEMVVSGDGERVRHVLVRDLPTVLQDRSFFLALAGSLEGVFDVCELEGKVRQRSPVIGASVEFEVTWFPRELLEGR